MCFLSIWIRQRSDSKYDINENKRERQWVSSRKSNSLKVIYLLNYLAIEKNELKDAEYFILNSNLYDTRYGDCPLIKGNFNEK